LQRDAFAEVGYRKIFTERLSGAVTDRPALRKALEFARSGDTLMANPDIPVIQIAQRLGVSPATLHRYISAAQTANTPGV
jgi:winged helix-turn-helix DNA-binding protein/resolvase-like protein